MPSVHAATDGAPSGYKLSLPDARIKNEAPAATIAYASP
jgi:hypothetical protein